MAIAIPKTEMYLVLGGQQVDLDSLQGLWSEEQYLRLAGVHPIEFTDGDIEVLPMPTRDHEAIIRFLFLALYALIQPRGGDVFFMGLRVRVRPGKYREPDVLLLLDSADPRNQKDYWLGADLVVEVVSPDNPDRDLRVKRQDYAEAGIPEYWIVNPLDETITVLRLAGEKYTEHGIFQRGENMTSALMADFSLAVDDVLDSD